MTLPEAHIGHRTSERIRIRIPSRRGDEEYFSRVRKSLSEEGVLDSVEVNPATAGVLLKGPATDVENIISIGEKKRLFKLEGVAPKVEPLFKRIAEPIQNLGQTLDRLSGGELDLAGVIFLGLIGWGVTQLARGNFASPPWYTAFWYALGVFTKSLADKKP